MGRTDQREPVADGISQRVDVWNSLLERWVLQPWQLVMLRRATDL